MTDREFFLKQRAAEFPGLLKCFEALPEENLDYRPHPESRSARELASHIIYGDVLCTALIRESVADYREPEPAENKAVLLDRVGAADREFRAALETLGENDWNRKVHFKAGRKDFEVVLGEFLWFIHFGIIHHRGQLTTYLRPMGGKVPALYGPSRDERGGL